MAGNGSIQFLRGTSTQRNSATIASQVLLPGQPFFETDTGLLYVGETNRLSVMGNAAPITPAIYWHFITCKITTAIGSINSVRFSIQVPSTQASNLTKDNVLSYIYNYTGGLVSGSYIPVDQTWYPVSYYTEVSSQGIQLYGIAYGSGSLKNILLYYQLYGLNSGSSSTTGILKPTYVSVDQGYNNFSIVSQRVVLANPIK